MTSLAFILGVAPLAVATGAGAEMRQSLGTAVLFGMLGVTLFGLVFTPAFYTFIRKLGRKQHGGGVGDVGAHAAFQDDRQPTQPA
jgi:Cu/Ag efflux pump CusA